MRFRQRLFQKYPCFTPLPETKWILWIRIKNKINIFFISTIKLALVYLCCCLQLLFFSVNLQSYCSSTSLTHRKSQGGREPPPISPTPLAQYFVKICCQFMRKLSQSWREWYYLLSVTTKQVWHMEPGFSCKKVFFSFALSPSDCYYWRAFAIWLAVIWWYINKTELKWCLEIAGLLKNVPTFEGVMSYRSMLFLALFT